ncbi:unnamed protein product [Amoebophrya sp. A120]|nr:unnamed protein product [Amoebophrya sp. A120]|eukprot:GSA120T00012801001.1
MVGVAVEVRLPDGAEVYFSKVSELFPPARDSKTSETPLRYPEHFNKLRPLDILVAIKRRLHKLREHTQHFSSTLSPEMHEEFGNLVREDPTVVRLILTTPLHCLRLYNNNAESSFYGRVLDNITFLGHASSLDFLNGLCNSNLSLPENADSVQGLIQRGSKSSVEDYIGAGDRNNKAKSAKPLVMKLAIIGTGLRNENESAPDFIRYVIRNRSLLFVDLVGLCDSTQTYRRPSLLPGADAATSPGGISPKAALVQGAEMALLSIAGDELASQEFQSEASPQSSGVPPRPTSAKTLTLSEAAFYVTQFERPEVLDPPSDKLTATSVFADLEGMHTPGMTQVEKLPQPLLVEKSANDVRARLEQFWETHLLNRQILLAATQNDAVSAAAVATNSWKLLNEVEGTEAMRRVANLMLTGDYVVQCLEDYERTTGIFTVENEDKLHSNVGDRWKVTLLQAFRDEEAALMSVLELLPKQGSTALQAVHPEHDGTILHDAVQRGFYAVVYWLKNERPDEFYQMLGQVDQYGYTPLQYACEEGALVMCELLWAVPDDESPVQPLGSSYPGQIASALNMRVPTMSFTREAAINQGSAYPYCVHGRTPLHGACFFGCNAVVKAILAHPLFLSNQAAQLRDLPSSEPKQDLLFSAYMVDALGRNPLHWACLGGHTKIVDRLINWVLDLPPKNVDTKKSLVSVQSTSKPTADEPQSESAGALINSREVSKMSQVSSSGTKSPPFPGGAPAAGPTPAASQRLAKLFAARDRDGFGVIDFACGSAGALDRERWFVRGASQQELRVVMPGVVVSQGTDALGVCRMRWAAREQTSLLPLGDLGTTGLLLNIKYLLAQFLAQIPGLHAAKGVLTLPEIGRDPLPSHCKQLAVERNNANQSTSGNKTGAAGAKRGTTSALIPSSLSDFILEDGLTPAQTGAQTDESARRAAIVLESYLWLNEQLNPVDTGAFEYSPDAKYYPERLIDGNRLPSSLSLVLDRIRVLDLDVKGRVSPHNDFSSFTGRVLLLHHSGNATMLRLLVRSSLKLAFSNDATLRAQVMFAPSLGLRQNFVDRCLFNGLVGEDEKTLVLAEFFKNVLQNVTTLPFDPAVTVTPLDILTQNSEKINPRSAQVQAAPPVAAGDKKKGGRPSGPTSAARKTQTPEQLAAANSSLLLTAFLSHPFWRGRIVSDGLIPAAVRKADIGLLSTVLQAVQKNILEDIIAKQVWVQPPLNAENPEIDMENTIKKCAGALEMCLRGFWPAVSNRSPKVTGVFPPNYLSNTIMAALLDTAANPEATGSLRNLLRQLISFFLHDILDAFCLQMETELKDVPQLSAGKRDTLGEVARRLCLQTQTRCMLDLCHPAPVESLLSRMIGQTEFPHKRTKHCQSLLKQLLAVPWVVHENPFTANKLSLWRLDEQAISSLRQAQLKALQDRGTELLPVKTELITGLVPGNNAANNLFGTTSNGGSKSKSPARRGSVETVEELKQTAADMNTNESNLDLSSPKTAANENENTTSLAQSGTVGAAAPAPVSCFAGLIQRICGSSSAVASSGSNSASAEKNSDVFVSASIALKATMLYEVALEAQRISCIYVLDERSRTVFHNLIRKFLRSASEEQCAVSCLQFLDEEAERAKEEKDLDPEQKLQIFSRPRSEGSSALVEETGVNKPLEQNVAEQIAASSAASNNSKPPPGKKSVLEYRMASLAGNVVNLDSGNNAGVETKVVDAHRSIEHRLSVGALLFHRLCDCIQEPLIYGHQDGETGNTIFHYLMQESVNEATAVLLLRALTPSTAVVVRSGVLADILQTRNRYGQLPVDLVPNGTRGDRMRAELARLEELLKAQAEEESNGTNGAASPAEA